MNGISLFDLNGRVAAVIGGNGGIGHGMAECLAGAGASILVAGRNPEKKPAAAERLRALGPSAETLELDITGAEAGTASVTAVERALGRLDIPLGIQFTVFNLRYLPISSGTGLAMVDRGRHCPANLLRRSFSSWLV